MRSVWAGDGFVETAAVAADAVVVESFLAVDGRVRSLGRHHRRMRETCRALGMPVDDDRLAGFFVAVEAQVPRVGRWFPRLEVHRGAKPDLVLWVRSAPASRADAVVWCGPVGDPRLFPRCKGPDLCAQAELRAAATTLGADDALIRDPRGHVLETAHHGLVWWDGADLCVVDPGLPRLRSVTVDLIVEHVEARGGRVRPKRAVLANLLSCEVWAVNALHGIRVVDRWLFEDRTGWWAPVADRARRDDVRAALEAAAADTRMQPAGGR